MQGEDTTQDSESSQNMGSVNGGTEEAFYVQQSEDSQSSLPGATKLDARDEMYTMQDYYNQMQYPNTNAGVAMTTLDSDSNSRSYAPDDPSYTDMMLQMQGEESNNTRDSGSISQNFESVNGSLSTTENMESQQFLGESESEQSIKRKLDEEEEDEDPDASNIADPSNSESGSGPPTKKALLELNIRKLLPDLEKHWKPVEDDPNDFQAWTYLLQYVDQENELLAAREAYDAFLSKYPYCYGYWKKYADYEKRKGSADDCEQVFRRGLSAISLSVDLWIHYLNYCKAAHELQPDYIRTQYEAATLACGLEFRSDKLWEHYIQWEQELNELKNVVMIYEKLISTPTQKYMDHFQSLKSFVEKHQPEDILNSEEYSELKATVQAEAAPEELDVDLLVDKIREKIIEKRTELHKANEAEITSRWSFEESIKRPYFHVKPLEKGQLKMWKEYLEFEIEKGGVARVIVLFERCLIACALYEEYWIKYIKFLQDAQQKDSSITERLRDVFARACSIHHQNKPWINLHWAAFEESDGHTDRAVEIIEKLIKTLPNSIHAVYRLVNIERRRGNLRKCCEIFDSFTSQAKNTIDVAHITIKYAQFLTKNLDDFEKAKDLLRAAVNKNDITKPKVIMALVGLGLDRQPVDIELVLNAFDEALHSNIPEEQKVTFAHRKIEFLEEYSNDILSIEKAHEELQSIAKALRDKRINPSAEDPNKVTGTGSEDSPKANANGAAPNQYNNQAYGQQYNQYGSYANWNYQQPTGYAGYNQQGWSAYQGYYG